MLWFTVLFPSYFLLTTNFFISILYCIKLKKTIDRKANKMYNRQRKEFKREDKNRMKKRVLFISSTGGHLSELLQVDTLTNYNN